jgi:hypothetical protein
VKIYWWWLMKDERWKMKDVKLLWLKSDDNIYCMSSIKYYAKLCSSHIQWIDDWWMDDEWWMMNDDWWLMIEHYCVCKIIRWLMIDMTIDNNLLALCKIIMNGDDWWLIDDWW